MKRVLPCDAPLALYDLAGIRSIEHGARAALEPNVLMQRAGLALARLALALAPHARGIWVAAGPGNNGGDGFEAALHLHRWGKRVAVSMLADEAALPADARLTLARARAAGVAIVAGLDFGFAPDLAIDALLGIGASRAPDERLAAGIRTLNALPCPVLAADIPSGLHADTGTTLGPDCVIASHTLSLLALKPGLFTGVGRDHCGTVWFDNLKVDAVAVAVAVAPAAWLSGASQLRDWPRMRQHAQHKGSFGDVAVVGGAAGMSGAALLAARAALAAGAGRVFVDLLGEQDATHDPQRPELMLRPGWAAGAHDALRKSLVVCGCGAGDAVRKVLPKLLSHVPRLVLDADALNAIASDTSLQNQLTARAGRGHVTLMTPHPLEAARLLGCSTAQVQADRIGTATRLANGFNAVIVLKGSGSVIAAPGRTPHLNPTGNPALASAGTGDVLAGWLGGSWSQGRPGERPQADDIRRPPPAGDEQSGKATFAHERPQADDIRRPPCGSQAARPSPATHERAGARSARAQPPEGDEQSGKATFAHEGVDAAFDAACAAAYLHGLAAEGIRAGPLRAADLIERMHQIVRTSIA